VADDLGDLADVDLGVEVGGEGVAVVTGVAVEDVDGFDAVVVVLLGPGAEDVGDPGIEAAAEHRHQALVPEFVLVGPLPAVLEMGRIRRLVVGGVEIVDPALEAGVHDRQILVGQGDVDHQLRLDGVQEDNQLRDAVGVDLGGSHRDVVQLLDLGGDGVALGPGAAGEDDLLKDFGMLGAFFGDDVADTPGPYDQYP